MQLQQQQQQQQQQHKNEYETKSALLITLKPCIIYVYMHINRSKPTATTTGKETRYCSKSLLWILLLLVNNVIIKYFDYLLCFKNGYMQTYIHRLLM